MTSVQQHIPNGQQYGSHAPASLGIPETDGTGSQGRRGSSVAAEIANEDEHYPIDNAPPVIVFFSFLDARSKQWAVEHQVVHNIRKNVPQGTTVSRCHAPMRDTKDFGEQLTHAWAVAKSLHMDDKFITPMFEAIREKGVHDLEGIRSVFNDLGVDPSTFLKEWARDRVIADKEAMDRAVAHLDLQDVPCILVRGKDLVKLSDGKDFTAEQAVGAVKRLLARE
ncbi:hypothetical protein LTR51_004363 [Lithohypha guttulata]|uniref:DSBA-like thioredoxin domain-containing protein n=1 Tax=Lithohypha guttulata TaxID=1690604 RepID=A0AAN7TE32_9EURO|nr:hypothetical protein LTR51_004363 [Lithohypha guttulata]KAK5090971.1 hypothetical protein LTR05_001149 [Lithohypha guttulata]